MRYGLKNEVLGNFPFYKLTKEQYDECQFLVDCLQKIVTIEEIYGLLIENYREFEMEILECSLQKIIYTNPDMDKTRTGISHINRRIICKIILIQ